MILFLVVAVTTGVLTVALVPTGWLMAFVMAPLVASLAVAFVAVVVAMIRDSRPRPRPAPQRPTSVSRWVWANRRR